MFNDTYTLLYNNGNGDIQVPLTFKDVAWEVDKTRKFKNPEGDAWRGFFNGTDPKYVKPVAWKVSLAELGKNTSDQTGMQNTDFMVWMRTAALPNFRKLWRKLNRTNSSPPYDQFKDGLPAGAYTLMISYGRLPDS